MPSRCRTRTTFSTRSLVLPGWCVATTATRASTTWAPRSTAEIATTGKQTDTALQRRAPSRTRRDNLTEVCHRRFVSPLDSLDIREACYPGADQVINAGQRRFGTHQSVDPSRPLHNRCVRPRLLRD